MAVTDEKYFNEDESYTVAVPKEQEALKQHIVFSYPQWKLVDYDSLTDAADMVTNEKADCFLMGASQALIYDNNRDFKSVPLTKTMEACFAVRDGEGTLLSILNKTLKAMPSDMLTSALAIYDSTADKVTFSDFVKDNLLVFFATVGFFALSIIVIILVLLRKARKSEAAAKLAASDTQKLNDKLEIALKKCPSAARIPELASASGIAPSSTPCGQMYLQKKGSPIPSELVTNAGSSITKTTRITYFRYRRGFSFAVESFLPGILCSRSWNHPNGQRNPQINRPNRTPNRMKNPVM